VLRLLSRDYATIEAIDDRGADVSGYLATYLLPIIVVGVPTTNDIIAYGVVISTMGLVYVRSRMIPDKPDFLPSWISALFCGNKRGLCWIPLDEEGAQFGGSFASCEKEQAAT
jgi:hypothetical protein